MTVQCVACPYRLGKIKTAVNPCLQCSSGIMGKKDKNTEKNSSSEKKD